MLHKEGKCFALTLDSPEALWALINHEPKFTLTHHALPLEVPADNRGTVVAKSLRKMTRREAHDPLPDGSRGTAGEDEVAGSASKLPLGVRLLIEREGTDAIDHVLQVRWDREVPDGGGDDDAVRGLHKLL